MSLTSSYLRLALVAIVLLPLVAAGCDGEIPIEDEEEDGAEIPLLAINGPLSRHEGNPRYFTDDSGRAIYLSGSHTHTSLGAILGWSNLDYGTYLNFLSGFGHNFIRLWMWESGSQVTPAPWPRDASGRYDLSRVDPAWLSKLRGRVALARDRGIYVSVMLFQGWSTHRFGPDMFAPWRTPWNGHPFRGGNNLQGVNADRNGDGDGAEFHTLASATVLQLQKQYVKRVVDELRGFDNVLYEICNECAADSAAWQDAMIDYIHQIDGRRHPVGMTHMFGPSTGPGTVAALYLSSADWVSPNDRFGPAYSTNPPIADGRKVVLLDTDHLANNVGTAQPADGRWVWKAFLRGYNPIYMDVTPPLIHQIAGWETPTAAQVRANMGATVRYSRRVDLAAMRPNGAPCSTGYCLVDPGSAYLIYQPGTGAFTADVARGTYAAEWFSPVNGSVVTSTVQSPGGVRSFTPPAGWGQAVLLLKATDGGGGGTGPIGHWALNDGAGTTAVDSSGRSGAATLRGNAAWTSGVLGGAIALDGNGDYLQVPASAALSSPTTAITVTAWVRRRALSSGYGVVAGRRLGTGYSDAYALFYNRSTRDEYAFALTTSSGVHVVTGPASDVDVGRWVHLAATYDGAALRLYRDGALVATTPCSGAIAATSTPLMLGAGDNGQYGIAEFIDAMLDDVRLYPRALSTAEIQALDAAGG